MPLSERARVEVYLPDFPNPIYQELLATLRREFTYTFEIISSYADKLRASALAALEEDAILVAVMKTYHAG